MKTNKFFINAFLCLTLSASFISCSDDDDNNIPELIEGEEDVTSIVLTFINQDDSDDTVVLTWEDANEDLIQDEGEKTVTGTFTSGEVYNATVGLFAEEEDFLEEDILSEQDAINAHFFVYSTTADFTVDRSADSYTRADGNKLGINTEWTAVTAGTGTINIQLFHESPTVSDADGFGTAEGTDTDIDISFTVTIEAPAPI